MVEHGRNPEHQRIAADVAAALSHIHDADRITGITRQELQILVERECEKACKVVFTEMLGRIGLNVEDAEKTNKTALNLGMLFKMQQGLGALVMVVLGGVCLSIVGGIGWLVAKAWQK